MGNVCSPSIQFSCDYPISHCFDCTARKARLITQLPDNLVALKTELKRLTEERDDVSTRVTLAEQQQMKRLEKVQGWLTRVHDEEVKAEMLIQQSDQEVEQLCLGGFCSKNCKSSYEIGKQVVNTLRVLKELRAEGDFEEVAQTAPENPVDERPIPSTIAGLEPIFEKVWRCITEEQAGIIGIYGMGGVGKTTLLNKINNKFSGTPSGFDVVIWAVVSKDLKLEKIQESIAKKIGLFNEPWKSKSIQEKASEIFKILNEKKFVLLLDDIWKEFNLTDVGLPPASSENASKVIFTTREFEVCGKMEAKKHFKVDCLRYEDAWRLFEEKVGREILDSHPKIPELAETVAKECGGLPLALITVGRAMACKRIHQEWEHAIEVLKSSASKFSDMEAKVFPCLKFSYDFLPDDKHRFCLLYCSLFPEDFKIRREDLIDCWLCEGFLDEYDGIRARNQGYSIIGTLLRACLLEEAGDDGVKMHDMIRDMALWITPTIEREKFLVLAGAGLIEAPTIKMGDEVTRISLMNNKITNLSESPSCPRLQSLFLGGNHLHMIESDFFLSMTSLRVLNLSHNSRMEHLPPGISRLVSLQHLDLSSTWIKKLPEELKDLVNLKCLNLEHTKGLRTISRQLISNLKLLRVLRMFSCGSLEQEEDSILFGGGELLVEELFGLKHLNVLTITLRSFYALQRFLSSPILQSSTRFLEIENSKDLKSLSVLSLASLRHLARLDLRGLDLEELKIEYTGELKSIRETHGFHHLQYVFINRCSKLRHMTWLIFAPNIKRIRIADCENMEAIIKLDEVPAEVVENLIPFSRLQYLTLWDLENLQSIYPNALQFLHLKEMIVMQCPKLHKLPLDYNSASEREFIIEGEECWWNELQWDNEATRSAFLPCFQSNRLKLQIRANLKAISAAFDSFLDLTKNDHFLSSKFKKNHITKLQ